ncbi:MAG TPA: saccharopine dehydrogenase NADP-binding domain-containing protein [Solirubrobacteraceae bacterium]|jgi:short subunit dehydrogenase-like uncharacterized protein
MAGRIVLFGATGYTGGLAARALVADGVRPVLAARNRARVQALAEELGGLECAAADVNDPRSVRALVQRGDVLLTTVGPFMRYGEAALAAAVDAGAHYIDSTGEAQFIRGVFERWGPRAADAGCGLLTAFASDWVPGNLAGALALREAGAGAAVTRIEAAYFATGIPFSASAMSGGTRASAMATMLDPSYAFRAGRLVSERAARHVRRFEVELGKRAPAVSVGGTEQFALPRLDPGVRDVEVYLGWLGPASRAAQALSVASSPIMRVPAVKRTLEGLLTRTVKGSTGGPDAAARERTGSVVLGAAYDAAGAKLATVRLEGVGPYDFTGPILAWGAQAAAAGKLSGVGALGPVDGFGLQMLQDGVAGAGIRQV